MTPIRTSWPLVFLLLIAGLFSAAQFGKLTLTLDLAVLHYGALAGAMVSVVGVVGIVFGAVAGAHIARFGVRRALLIALAAGAVLSGIQSLLPPAPVMVALRVAEGMSHLAIVVAAPTLMAGLASDRDRPVVMGIWASFFGVALALMAVMLPSILALGGLNAVFLTHGIGMGLVGLALWRVLPETPRSAEPPSPYIQEHFRIYSDPRTAIAGAGFVFYTVLFIALVAVLPGALGLSVQSISILPLISLIGTFGAGFLARRYPPALISSVGFGLTAAALLGVGLYPGFATALVLFLAVGLIPGGCFATIPYFNSTLATRARATGAIAQCGNIGTTTGTPIFIAALFWGGLPAVTALGIGFCAMGMVVIAVLAPKADLARRSAPQI